MNNENNNSSVIIPVEEGTYTWQIFVNKAAIGNASVEYFLASFNNQQIEVLKNAKSLTLNDNTPVKNTIKFNDNVYKDGLVTSNEITVTSGYTHIVLTGNKQFIENGNYYNVQFVEGKATEDYNEYFEPYEIVRTANSPYAEKEEVGKLESDLENTKGELDSLKVFPNTGLRTEMIGFDEKPIIAKFCAEREATRNKYLTESSKSVFWDNMNGSDDNTGISESQAVQTFEKAKSLLVNGDTLYIKYGSVINDVCEFDQVLKGVRIDTYGNYEDGNPVFDNLITVSNNEVEKVSGYNYVYRVKKHYEASEGTTNNMQMYIDGKRVGSISILSTGYANVSNKSITTLNEALEKLEANPDKECWFSGYETSAEWNEGDYYWYFSVSDLSNHKIEITNHVVNCLLDMYRLIECDLRHINTRGSAGKDGWNIGTDIFMEDCHVYNHAHHGFLSFNGFQKTYNCSAESPEGAIGYQFHYYGDSDEKARNAENISINPRIISSKGLGTAFAGHMGNANKKPYLAWYIIGGYITGCSSVIGAMPNVNSVYVKDVRVKNVSSLTGFNGYTVIEKIRGTLSSDNKTSITGISGYNGKLYMNDAVLSITTRYGIGGLLYDNQSDKKPTGQFKDCIFLIHKIEDDPINVTQTDSIIHISELSDYTFDNCVIAVDKGNLSYSQKLFYSGEYDRNVKFEDTVCFGIKNNGIVEDNFTDCKFVEITEMSEQKWMQKLMYEDKSRIKVASID